MSHKRLGALTVLFSFAVIQMLYHIHVSHFKHTHATFLFILFFYSFHASIVSPKYKTSLLLRCLLGLLYKKDFDETRAKGHLITTVQYDVMSGWTVNTDPNNDKHVLVIVCCCCLNNNVTK